MKIIKLTDYGHMKLVYYVNSDFIVLFRKADRGDSTFVSMSNNSYYDKSLCVKETPEDIMFMING